MEHFRTDWEGMTGADWTGLIMTVLIALLMIGLYLYVFRPKNREKLEAHRHIIIDENSSNKEDLNG
jgi:cytochrome c oxidase cbb3-type subunit 4